MLPFNRIYFLLAYWSLVLLFPFMKNLKIGSKQFNVFQYLVLLCALAIPITLYLTYKHFAVDGSSICNINARWNCEIVNKSEYAVLFGVPVSLIGLFGYLFMGFLSYVLYKGKNLIKFNKFLNQDNLKKILTFSIIGGVGFSLYLTMVEAFILKTYCLFCVAQQIIIILMLALILFDKHNSLNKGKKHDKF